MGKANLSTKDAIAEIRALAREIDELRNKVVGITGAHRSSFNAMENSVQKLRAASIKLNQTFTGLNATIKKQKSAIDNYRQAIIKLTEAKNKNNKASSNMAGNIRTLLGALGFAGAIQTIYNLLKNVVQLTIKFQSLGFAIKFTSGTVFEIGRSTEFLLDLNNRFGASLVSTTERWLKFRVAARLSGLTLIETKNIFESVTKASAVLGLSTDELRGVYLALEQMLSKGKVTTEELRRQLGERLPGSMGIMAKALGKTIPELDRMLKAGEILSADALPKFAKALEEAYGITAITAVDNLSTAVGKMTGQWQQLVLVISEGESTLTGWINGFLTKVERVLSKMTQLAMSFPQAARSAQGAFNSKILDEYSDRAEQIILKNKEFLKQESELIESRKVLTALIVAAQKAGDKGLEDSLTAQRNKLDLLKDEISARKQLLQAEDATNRLQGEVIKTEELFKKLEEAGQVDKSFMQNWRELADLMSEFRNDSTVQLDEEGNIKSNKILEERERILSFMTPLQREYVEQLEREAVTRELAEKGTAGDGIKTTPTAQTRLDEILDLEKQIEIERLKNQIKARQERIDDERTGIADEAELLKQSGKDKLRISQLELEIEIDQIKKAEKKKRDALDKLALAGKVSPDLAKSQREDIEKEANQKIEIANQGHLKRMLAQSADYHKDLKGLEQDELAERLSIEQDGFNDRIIALKEQFKEFKANSTDKTAIAEAEKQLQRDIANVAIEAGNAQIAVQIKLKEAIIATLEANEDTAEQYKDFIAQLKREIKSLQATIDETTNPPEDDDAWKEYWLNRLDMMKDFNSAFADLVDAIFDARIEKINAEIDAETKKYDKLLELAKGDEAQRDVLARSKELRIQALEKKRLKEEQKQAKAKKAFAISEIIINTAVAIMKAWGSPGFPAAIPLSILIGALGAVQIAAVAAQPIPQYKEGGVIKKNEVAMVNDGIFQEYIERKGGILTTKRKNAIVNLQKGDIVHKNYESLARKSVLMSALGGGSEISESEFNRMFLGITSSIASGFKKAKISNNINVQSRDDSYREKMSRWTR